MSVLKDDLKLQNDETPRIAECVCCRHKGPVINMCGADLCEYCYMDRTEVDAP